MLISLCSYSKKKYITKKYDARNDECFYKSYSEFINRLLRSVKWHAPLCYDKPLFASVHVLVT